MQNLARIKILRDCKKLLTLFWLTVRHGLDKMVRLATARWITFVPLMLSVLQLFRSYSVFAFVSPRPLTKTTSTFKSWLVVASERNIEPLAPTTRPGTSLQALFSKQAEAVPSDGYDLILVGSGNGACGFLTRYLDGAHNDVKILVLEQGKNFFYTSELTHQYAWTKAFSEGNIFKLHNARTPQGTPILAGRACTMGGGGSINYTMIHESSKWLAEHLGHDEKYWDELKRNLNNRFKRSDPMKIETPITKQILKAGQLVDYQQPNPKHQIENIPSYDDTPPPANAVGQLYVFSTQFNEFGQRTNSGVSLVNWDDRRITLRTEVTVSELLFEKDGDQAQCVSVAVKDLEAKTNLNFALAPGGRVLLCAGAASPRLLMPQRELLQNTAIGQDVNDHFAIPLGLYVPEGKLNVSPKDIYAPVFATTVWNAKEHGFPEGVDVVCGFDFFAGRLEQLLYLTSHLFLAFLPNVVKSTLLKQPILFTITKNVARTLVTVANLFITLFAEERAEFITAMLKFNPSVNGVYDGNGSDGITLNLFESEQDKAVAKQVISDNFALLENLGRKPHRAIRWIYHAATKIPFDREQIDGYIEHYSQKSLLSQQHMSGGCLYGKAIDFGITNTARTGQVYGTTNVHVSDLSTVPLPRVSPQMTAYLVGFHLANQLRGGK